MVFQPRDAFSSPRFSQPPTFMRLPYRDDLGGVDVAIVGAPFDGGTSYRPGARMAPREIRAQSSLIRPYNYFQQVAPFERLRVVDAGDVDASPVSLENAYRAIEDRIAAIAAAHVVPMVVGGDHSISLPVLRALSRAHGPLGLVQFDAHIDTWEQDFGSPYFHGSPFWHAVREGVVDPKRFIQIGIRGPMYHRDDFAFHREHAITVCDIIQVKDRGVAAIAEEIRRVATGPCYVTFDIDAVDPAFAPGTGTPEVGGLTSDEALRLVRGLAAGPRIVGCDVVEVSPLYDGPGQITAVLAANILFELLSVIARGMSE
jgi:agmatinase